MKLLPVNTFWMILIKNLLKDPGFSEKNPKCVQLWGAVSPSSVNIFSKFEKIRRVLCINFKLSLIRSKTGTWRKRYSRFKIGNIRKIAFTPPIIMIAHSRVWSLLVIKFITSQWIVFVLLASKLWSHNPGRPLFMERL